MIFIIIMQNLQPLHWYGHTLCDRAVAGGGGVIHLWRGGGCCCVIGVGGQLHGVGVSLQVKSTGSQHH